MINLVCDRALMVACEKQSSRIDEGDVGRPRGAWAEIPKDKIKGEKGVGCGHSATAIPAPSRRLDLHRRRHRPGRHRCRRDRVRW
jgi:hypothetical protein